MLMDLIKHDVFDPHFHLSSTQPLYKADANVLIVQMRKLKPAGVKSPIHTARKPAGSGFKLCSS